MQAATSFTFSNLISRSILAPSRVESALKSYFGSNYFGHIYEDDIDAQRRGVDLWVITQNGLVAVDLKACSTPVQEALHLEIYSVREERKLGYLLRADNLAAFILFIDRNGCWRMFRRKHLARALRSNFQHWVGHFGVAKQRTGCSWRSSGDYTSSSIRVPTKWIRGAYYSATSNHHQTA